MSDDGSADCASAARPVSPDLHDSFHTLQTSDPVPYSGIRQWCQRFFRHGLDYPDKSKSTAVWEGRVPSPMPVASRRPVYWSLSATGVKNGSLLRASLAAEAIWIAIHERELRERSREARR